jgi:hypothetical protein
LSITILVDNGTNSLSTNPGFVETEMAGAWRQEMKWLSGWCLCCAAHAPRVFRRANLRYRTFLGYRIPLPLTWARPVTAAIIPTQVTLPVVPIRKAVSDWRDGPGGSIPPGRFFLSRRGFVSQAL